MAGETGESDFFAHLPGYIYDTEWQVKIWEIVELAQNTCQWSPPVIGNYRGEDGSIHEVYSLEGEFKGSFKLSGVTVDSCAFFKEGVHPYRYAEKLVTRILTEQGKEDLIRKLKETPSRKEESNERAGMESDLGGC